MATIAPAQLLFWNKKQAEAKFVRKTRAGRTTNTTKQTQRSQHFGAQQQTGRQTSGKRRRRQHSKQDRKDNKSRRKGVHAVREHLKRSTHAFDVVHALFLQSSASKTHDESAQGIARRGISQSPQCRAMSKGITQQSASKQQDRASTDEQNKAKAQWESTQRNAFYVHP